VDLAAANSFCLVGRKGSSAGAASEDSVDQRDVRPPMSRRRRAAVARDLGVGSAHALPIADLEDLLWHQQAGTLGDGHPVVTERLLGSADRWWVGP
jgi:hypothetical protein